MRKQLIVTFLKQLDSSSLTDQQKKELDLLLSLLEDFKDDLVQTDNSSNKKALRKTLNFICRLLGKIAEHKVVREFWDIVDEKILDP